MKTNIIIAVLFVTISLGASAQNYISVSDGNWTTAPRWNNTSGWGTATPPIDGSHGSGAITMNNNMTVASSYTIGSSTLNIVAGKSLTVNGNMTLNGGSTVNVYGTLTINGDLTLNSSFNVFPGGVVIVNGNAIVVNSNYLVVGSNAAPPPYADFVVRSDLKQQSSGDVTFNRNSRVVVFGNVIGDNGGGTKITLNDGAEMYVDGKIQYTGGGDQINNYNTLSPYGLYVNSTTTNTGGGSTTTSNKANRTTMQATNPAFTSWVNSMQNLMPVSLLFFEAVSVSDEGILLKWATASEENFDHFVIESSTDGVGFNEIAQIQGNGTTKLRHDYNYTVDHPIVGRTYFMLKSVDYDGHTETFKVVGATYESGKSVKVFPNPVVDSKLNLVFNFTPTDDVTVSITNMSGMEVSRLSVNGMENLLLLSIDAGTYLLKISSAEVSTVTRIVIR